MNSLPEVNPADAAVVELHQQQEDKSAVQAVLPPLEPSVVKSLFASMNDTLRAQLWAATAVARPERHMRAMRFAVHVLLPRMTELRTRGLWLIKLRHPRCQPQTSSCPDAAGSTAGHMIIETEELAELAPLLMSDDILPPGWHFDITDAFHATLRCQPAVGDEVHVHCTAVAGAGAGAGAAGPLTCIFQVTQLHPEDLGLLTIAWPWQVTTLARIDFESGQIHTCASSVAVAVDAAATAPTPVGAPIVPVTPEAHQFQPLKYFEAALAATKHEAAHIQLNRLHLLLIGRPFVVKDRIGNACPAVVHNVMGSLDHIPMKTVVEFAFPGFPNAENVKHVMDSTSIVAVLPHHPEGLGKFMFAHGGSAVAMWSVKDCKVWQLVKRDVSTDAEVQTFHCRAPEAAATVMMWMTPTTYAIPVVGYLHPDLMYPLVCQMTPQDLMRVFADGRLYAKAV